MAEICSNLLNKGMFLSLNKEFTKAILMKLDKEFFNAGDIIIHQNAQPDNMFFIDFGRVLVKNEAFQMELCDGDHIGEISFLFGGVQSATVSALTTCSPFTLSLQEFQEIEEEFPHVVNELRGAAQQLKNAIESPAQRKRELQRPDDGRPSTSSKCSPRGQVPVEPMKTSTVPTAPGAMEDVNKSSTASDRSSGDAPTDSPPGIMSTPSLSDCVRDVVRRYCGSSSSLSSSDSFQEWMCPPLPGQVPVEPMKTSTVPTAPAAMEDVNKSSTGKPTKRKKRERIRLFIRNLWRSLSRCCSGCKSVDVVERFVPPLDLDSNHGVLDYCPPEVFTEP
ncbi:unnamed protein product [Leuciscus chuanchicus]